MNFRDASFDDVLALDWRFSGGLAWELTRSWSFVFVPVALDVVQAEQLGGYVVGWQILLGVSF